MKLSELIKAFELVQLPQTMKLSAHEHIFDVPLFVSTHIAVLQNHPRNKTFLPYYQRLLKLYQCLNSNSVTTPQKR